MSRKKAYARSATPDKPSGKSVPSRKNNPTSQETGVLVALFNAGRYAAAVVVAAAMTQRYPRHGFGWLALGRALQQMGRRAEALAPMMTAASLAPGDAQLHSLLGNTCQDLGRPEEAEACYRRALQIQPDFVEAHCDLGVLLQNSGRFDEAEACYRRAAQIDSGHGLPHYNLGNALRDHGRPAEAEACYRRALRINPDFAEAHNNLGKVLQDLARPGEAEACCRRALQINPNLAVAHNNRGNALKDLGRIGEAEACYRRALAINPDFAEALCNLGIVRQSLGRMDEAETAFRRASRLAPDYAEAHCNLGAALLDMGRLEEAEASLDRALEIMPEFVPAHCNLCLILQYRGRPEEAEVAFRRLLQSKPDYAEARMNLSLLLLGQGRYAEAWPHFESRWDPSRKDAVRMLPAPPSPRWQGESLTGKSFLIWPEQGFGDQIQFARYAALLKERGAARVSLFCAPALKPLLETAAGVDAVLTDPAAVPPHDYWSFPLSLPLHFATGVDTIPAALPYLHAPAAAVDRWRHRLPGAKLKVGLAWKGNPAHKNDGHRSLPGLAALAPLWSVAGVSFVSLQKGRGEGEAQAPSPERPIVDLGPDLADFADTAAIVAQLDLVICVDTALAHLAGALGKHCWVLLPAFRTDWRWLTDRSDSPWYPGALRLFRQPDDGDWKSVVARLVAALKIAAGGH